MPRHDWEAHKATIVDKYKKKGMRQMMSEMSGIGFNPARRSYFNKFEEWGIKKYAKREKKERIRGRCGDTPALMYPTFGHQLASSEADADIPLQPDLQFNAQMGEPTPSIELHSFNSADSSAGRDKHSSGMAELWADTREPSNHHHVETPRSFRSNKTTPSYSAKPFYSRKAGCLPVTRGPKPVAPEWDISMATESGLSLPEPSTEASIIRAPSPSSNAPGHSSTRTIPLHGSSDCSMTHSPTIEAMTSLRIPEEESFIPEYRRPAASNDVDSVVRIFNRILELHHDVASLEVDVRGAVAILRSNRQLHTLALLKYLTPLVSMILDLMHTLCNQFDSNANSSGRKTILRLCHIFLEVFQPYLQNKSEPPFHVREYHFALGVLFFCLECKKNASSAPVAASKPQGIWNPSPAIDPALASSSDQESNLLVHNITSNPFNSVDWSFDRLWGIPTTPEPGRFDFPECHDPYDFLRITETDTDRDGDQTHQQDVNLKKGKQLLPRTPPPPSPNWGDWIHLPTTP